MQWLAVVEQPGVAEHRFDLSGTLNEEADIYKGRRLYDEARLLYERVRTIRAELAAAHPTDLRFRGALAAAWNNLGLFHKDAGAPGPAEGAFKTAAALAESLPMRLNDNFRVGIASLVGCFLIANQDWRPLVMVGVAGAVVFLVSRKYRPAL